MAKPLSITVPFEVWEQLVKLVKVGAALDTAQVQLVLTYADECRVTLEALRAARDCDPPRE